MSSLTRRAATSRHMMMMTSHMTHYLDGVSKFVCNKNRYVYALVKSLHCVRKKMEPLFLPVTLPMLANFQNSFTNRLSSKFPAMLS